MSWPLLGDLADLLLARRCLGCDRAGPELCPACLAPLLTPPFSVALDRALPAATVATAYDGVVREAVIAYKEHGHRSLAPALGCLLAHAVRSRLQSLGQSRTRLIPVPSHRRSVRGFDALDAVARAAACELRDRGYDAAVIQPLRTSSDYLPMKGLGRDRRRRAAVGAFEPVPRFPTSTHARDGAVIVVDDIVTTGSTASEMVRVLRRSGIRVDGVAAVAATARRAR